ncbi:MAG: hypothetical protein QF864_05570, partial [SAR202 cluster bacterium]|nr:hypothetical protein [SAR202 cluster bacterium]
MTSVNQLIDLAGGFTESANESLVMIEVTENKQFDISNIANRPQDYLTESDIPWVDVGINHYINNKSIIHADELDDYKLIHGDKIKILPKVNFVEVVGAVNKPG